MSKYRLSFTIGPVQSFVAQARRTRDLWTGSWLLSLLSESSLIATEKLDGRAIIPHRGEYHKQLTSIRSAIGGIPNRFEVEFDSEKTAKQAGEAATAAFYETWQSVADEVWSSFVEKIATHGNQTGEIWKRQTKNFWELSWVVTPAGDPSQLAGLALNRRKQFRNVSATLEPGTKCSLMKEYQEISGHYGHQQWDRQRQFWDTFRGSVSNLDLKGDEKLCAIGVIKRFYPEVVDEHIAKLTGAKPQRSIKEQSRWPSLGFFAALPWLQELDKTTDGTTKPNKHSPKQLAQTLSEETQKPDLVKGQRVDGYQQSEHIPAKDFGLGNWGANVDATVWHSSGLANNLIGFTPQRVRKLARLQSDVFESMKPKKPIPYYALLLADGDSMGALVAQFGNPQDVSKGLNSFAGSVGSIISPENGNGRVVYAGGDDVFALLSAKTALDAAKQLSDSYRQAFRKLDSEVNATLSVAIVYAHFKQPLSSVIRTAHHLLDDIAKDKTGRDSLALGLIQASGLSAVWSSPWKLAYPEKSASLPEIIDQFSASEDDTAPFNSSYLQNLRGQITSLFDASLELPGTHQPTAIEGDVLLQIAHAEYRRRLDSDELKARQPDDTKPEIEKLMSLSHPRFRFIEQKQNEKLETLKIDDDHFGFDGWKIGRFLKQVQVGAIIDHE